MKLPKQPIEDGKLPNLWDYSETDGQNISGWAGVRRWRNIAENIVISM
jgi:hypothetical protein